MAAALVIGLLATPSSGAASSDSLPVDRAASVQTAGSSVLPTALYPAAQGHVERFAASGVMSLGRQSATRTIGVASDSGGEAYCRSARRAVKFYRARYVEWTVKRGAVPVLHRSPLSACPRYAVAVLQRKAHNARLAYLRWHRDHWEWRRWLPAKWQRIAVCETGLNWRHSNSSYEGAFGFALSSWDAFVPRAAPWAGPYPANAYLATPRQQYEVALAIWRAYGFSGWGCKSA